MSRFECVPNFSEGRDPKVIQAIVEAARSAPGVSILDIESNADHNRSVLSFVGDAAAVEEAAFRATAKAIELIDLNHHKGEHPRMGAMDVVPFIPLGEATMEEASAIAWRFGERAAKAFDIPVYFYGRAAKLPARSDLAVVRKGEYEGLKTAIVSDPTRLPDVGPHQLHPTGGAVAVGSRPVLVAYNAYLTTADVAIAKKIAKTIRGRDGGLAEVKALGFEIKERNRAQVSMNMTDYRRTPLHRALEMIRVEAARYGVAIEESEVVGLVPEDALYDAAEHYLQLNSFDRRQILERRLAPTSAPAGPTAGGFASGSVASFLAALAARTPTPGGGSAAALAGAQGCALGEMVLRYSAPPDQLPPDLTEKVARLAALRGALTAAIDGDARAYESVRAARAAKKAAPADPQAIEGWGLALQEAARVPLETAKASDEARRLLTASRGQVKATVMSDLTTALALLEAGMAGALANVEINLDSLVEAGRPTESMRADVARLRSPA